jgi:hypothetical protein
MMTDPSAIQVIWAALPGMREFSLSKRHFYPCSLQVSSSLRIAWAREIQEEAFRRGLIPYIPEE